MKPLAALLLVALAAGCHREKEPMAGGKPLSHWKKEAQQVSWMSFWNSTKDERRHEAFRRLSEIGDPAVPTLVELFRKNRIPVSGDAFNALANLGPRAASALPDLLEILNRDTTELRLRAAWILGTIGPAAANAVPSLTPLLDHPNLRLRQVAAQALGQIGGSGHVALERARGSDDARLREASMRGMAARPLDAGARREYIAGALADPEPEVRLRAVDLLMTARRDEVEALAEYLVKALNDSDPGVKQAAHRVLTVYLQHGSATPPLLAAVVHGGDAESRTDAAWHLGQRLRERFRLEESPNAPGVIDALVGALEDPEVKVRIYAARALAYGEGDSREQGLRLLRREMPSVEAILAVRAARVLWDAAHSVDEVRRAYEAGLRDPEKWNRVETISAITDMGRDAEPFVPQLEQLKSDPDPEVRDRAGKALYAMRVAR